METNNQNNPPAPKGDWRTGKSPLNVRPRGEQIAYMEDLIRTKGSAQSALSYLIDLGRTGTPDTRQFTAKIEELQAELKRTKEALSARPAAIEITAKPQLEKVMKARKLTAETVAIDYCIKYTAKNDWL